MQVSKDVSVDAVDISPPVQGIKMSSKPSKCLLDIIGARHERNGVARFIFACVQKYLSGRLRVVYGLGRVGLGHTKWTHGQLWVVLRWAIPLMAPPMDLPLYGR